MEKPEIKSRNSPENLADGHRIGLIKFVDDFLQRLSTANRTQPFCHTVLCKGLNSSKLRLLEFIFAQKISRKFQEEVHLIRSNHLPNLISQNDVCHLYTDIETIRYLSLLKIYYLDSFEILVDQLLSISTANGKQLLPIAFIIDDINAYIHSDQYSQSSQSSGFDNEDQFGPPWKRFKSEEDGDLQTLIRICSLLLETIEYCASKLKKNTFLILKLDLNDFFVGNVTRQKSFQSQLIRRYFQHQIDVDLI